MVLLVLYLVKLNFKRKYILSYFLLSSFGSFGTPPFKIEFTRKSQLSYFLISALGTFGNVPCKIDFFKENLIDRIF